MKEKTPLDEEGQLLQFSKRRVTDLPTNRRINVPEPEDDGVEVVFANMKNRISQAARKYIDQNCEENGMIKTKNSNTTEEVRRGTESLKERSKRGEIVVTMTDKSGKMSVNTRENYVESMQKHIKDDPVMSWEEKEKLERNINGHTLQLGRILEVGENFQHEERVKNALRNKNCHVPGLAGLAKDHKENIDLN